MTCDEVGSDDSVRKNQTQRGLKRKLTSSMDSHYEERPEKTAMEAKKARKIEIETEFRILKSLIPNIADKQQINELEIIDACVNYIEALQDQLNIRQHRPSLPILRQPLSTPSSGVALGASDDDEDDYEDDEEDEEAFSSSSSSSTDSEDDDDENEENNNRSQRQQMQLLQRRKKADKITTSTTVNEADESRTNNTTTTHEEDETSAKKSDGFQ